MNVFYISHFSELMYRCASNRHEELINKMNNILLIIKSMLCTSGSCKMREWN